MLDLPETLVDIPAHPLGGAVGRCQFGVLAFEFDELSEEGVELKFLRNPAEIVETESGLKVKLQVVELGPVDAKGRRRPIPVAGKFEELEVSTLVMAIGQRADERGFEALPMDGVEVCGDASAKGAGYSSDQLRISISAFGINAIVAKHIKSFFRDMDDQFFNEFKGMLCNIFFILTFQNGVKRTGC